MDLYLCPPKVDLRGLSVTQGVIPLQMQYNGSYCRTFILGSGVGASPRHRESLKLKAPEPQLFISGSQKQCQQKSYFSASPKMFRPKCSLRALLILVFPALLSFPARCLSLSSSTVFHGQRVVTHQAPLRREPSSSGIANLEMRKQKASDRRTRKLQKGETSFAKDLSSKSAATLTQSPATAWSHKRQPNSMPGARDRSSGRGRSRKRSALYNSLSLYHNKFMSLLTEEYRLEVRHQLFFPCLLRPMTASAKEINIRISYFYSLKFSHFFYLKKSINRKRKYWVA
jgi:hypothetical protein